MSWMRVTPGLSDSLTIRPQLLLCHHYDVVVLVRDLPLLVEVDQFLLQRLSEQFEIFFKHLSILLCFLNQSLSSADVVQRILDFLFCVTSSTCVVFEDSDLYVGRRIAHTSDVTPVTRISRRSSRAWCASWENRDNRSLSLRKSSCSSCRTCVCICTENNAHLTISCQSNDNILPRNRFILKSGSTKFILWMKQSTSSPFAQIIQSFSCSLCNQLNNFLRSKNYRYTLKSPRIYRGLIWYRMETGNIPHEVALSLWGRWPMQNYWMQHLHSREAATGCRTYENFRLHRPVSNPLSAQTFRSYPSHCCAHNLCLVVGACSFRHTTRNEHAEECEDDWSQDVPVVDMVSVALRYDKPARMTWWNDFENPTYRFQRIVSVNGLFFWTWEFPKTSLRLLSWFVLAG